MEPAMTELRRVPTGRAGRLWLLSRLRTGRLAADLLDRKLRILRAELERSHLVAERAEVRWRAAWREADRWGLRAAILSGQRESELSAPATRTDVTVTWASVMGVRYPVDAQCRLPLAERTDRSPGSAAMVEAKAAYEEAVRAGVAHAAAAAACRIIDAEIATTRRRLRAIVDRWVPRLETALTGLTHELDETERAETFRLRWAAARARREAQP
jgi:V/A-type H+-transporting ATPase subunit D